MYNLNLSEGSILYELPYWHGVAFGAIRAFSVFDEYKYYILLYCGYCKTYHGFEDPEGTLYDEVVQDFLVEHKHDL